MHPNVFLELSSELQVMCHLSKVQLRNFWTWIPMILRIFFGNKGTVLLFSYWICLRLFLGGSSAADFKSAQFEAFNGTCDFSSSNFFSFFWLIWICTRIHLEEYHEPVFLHLQQVYSVYCNFLCTHLKHWRLRGRKSKKAWYISALSW